MQEQLPRRFKKARLYDGLFLRLILGIVLFCGMVNTD